MPKNTKTTKEAKQPKTVKVSTLVKTGVIILALAASYFAGVYTNNQYKDNVRQEAAELVSSKSKQ